MIVLNEDNLKNINSIDDLQRYQIDTIDDNQFNYFCIEMNNQEIQSMKEIQPVLIQNKNDDTIKDVKTQYTRQQTYELFASNKIQKQTKRIQAQKNAQQQSQNLQQQLTTIQQNKILNTNLQYFPPYLQESNNKDFYTKEGLLAASLLNYIAQNKDILDNDYVQVQLQNQDQSKLTGNIDLFTTVLNTRTLYQQNKQLFDYLQPKQTSDLLTLLFGCVTSYIDKVPSHIFNSDHVKKDKKLLCLILALAAKLDDDRQVNLKTLSTILQEKPKDIYNAARLCGFKIQGGVGKLIEKPSNE